MKFGNPSIWIGILSTIGVMALVIEDIDKAAPGDLSAVHGRMEELSGSQNCNQCHGGWGQSMADACLECHEAIEVQLGNGEGLHGGMSPDSELTCGLCHGEHHGSSWSLVNPQSFAMSGAGSREDFDHEMIGFRMVGGHLDLNCVECHVYADDEVLTEGGQRFGGLDQNCASCHDDSHDGRMVIDCASCHGQVAFTELESFEHEQFLSLDGGHASQSCEACHAESGEHGLRETGEGVAGSTRATCSDCHESPHRSEFIARAMDETSFTEGETCQSCHLPAHKKFLGSRVVVTADMHALTGFALDAPHDLAACKDCHGDPGTEFEMNVAARLRGDCRACHEDPHGGQFDGEFGDRRECAECHADGFFEPHEFSTELHAETKLELLGTHAELDCSECHEDPDPESEAARAFASLSHRCESCHLDGHDQYFQPFLDAVDLARFEEEKRVTESASCELCHDATSFSEVDSERFDHGATTPLVIAGAHEQTDCESCHQTSLEPDESGRSFGRVEKHFGEFRGCVTCHEDPHEGGFDSAEFEIDVNGREDCARCHNDRSFRVLNEEFDHGAWTEFALEGQHAEISCSECHSRLAQAGEHGRTWGRAAGMDCATCHADPHVGQFVVGGSIDCSRCHNSAFAFQEIVFDHERDSSFELGEAHINLECSVCHPSVEVAENAEVVRYRPLESNCVDCHGSHEDRTARGKGGR
ncbi:MAG: hypothetical protein ACI8TQ_001469 [Planctomycetota bacterium]|jgi:hypothetical protein